MLYSQYIYLLVLYTINNKLLFGANNDIHKYKTRIYPNINQLDALNFIMSSCLYMF